MMKRKLWKFISLLCMAVLLAMPFVMPAEAASEEIITSLETDSLETEVQGDWMNESPKLDHVTDEAGVLSEEEWQLLENQAIMIEEEHDFGIYIVLVNNYTDYTYGTVQDAAETIYRKYSLGLGAEKDGVMLLLSMDDRDFSLITHGTHGNYTFNDEGRQYLTEYFLDDFAENDWYAGLADYIFWSGLYLSQASNGEPYSASNVPMSAEERATAIAIDVLIIFIVPLIIAGIYVAGLSSKLKNVEQATKAANYVVGDLKLNKKIDRFTHRTETRTKIETSSDSGGSSGGGSRSSGGSSGFSGTSGKF